MDNDDFVSSVSSVSGTIGDAPIAPVPVEGMPPMTDPMRPWTAIPVKAYLPLAMGAYSKAFSVAAERTKEPAWQLSEWEKDGLHDPMEEALQRLIYDLKAANIASNPYVQLLIATAGVVTVKMGSIEAKKMMARNEAQKRSQQPPNLTGMTQEWSEESIRMPESEGASFSQDSQTQESPFSFDNGSGEGDA